MTGHAPVPARECLHPLTGKRSVIPPAETLMMNGVRCDTAVTGELLGVPEGMPSPIVYRPLRTLSRAGRRVRIRIRPHCPVRMLLARNQLILLI